MNLNKLFPSAKANKELSKEKLAEILQTSPEVLEAFEKAYSVASMSYDESTGYKHAKTASASAMQSSQEPDKDLITDIAEELLSQTKTWTYTHKHKNTQNYGITVTDSVSDLTVTEYKTTDELNKLPIECRPFLTGNAVVRHIQEDAYPHLLQDLHRAQTHPDPDVRRVSYSQFRRGLDILDLDPIMYEMLGCNPNSMSHWLPAMTEAIENEGFFNVPDTTIAKVPLPLLQLTRMDYTELNRVTLDIVNTWAQKAFKLDTNKKYFIKTGTYSSKFDFRNAKVTDPAEVLDIGEYLLYIHNSSVQIPCYGVATTNEWVVREFIEDEDNEMTIYHGLPLHTEYRVFVDFDKNEVFGVHNYWDPDIMLERFSKHTDANTPDMIHDFVTFQAQAEKLTKRFEENKALVAEHIKALLPDVNLTGQWSIDIMQNGNKFWLIDMAIAEQSAFYEQEVPVNKRIKTKENWIPQIPELNS